LFKFFLLFIITIGLYIGAVKYVFPEDNIKEAPIQKENFTKNKNIEIITDYEENSTQKTDIKKNFLILNQLKDEIKALFEKANNLAIKEDYQGAIKIYDKIIDKLQNIEDLNLLKSFTQAHFFRAYIYRNYLQDTDEAIKDYNIIIEKFKNSDNISILKLYYNAQSLKAYLLDKDEALEVYNEITEKFGKSENIELLKKYISAQYSKTYLLNEKDTLEIYDEIIKRFKTIKNKELLKELANTEFSKARLLNDSFQNTTEAIEVYDDIINQFESYEDNEFKQVVADALFAKSYLLMNEDGEESMEILDELIDRYKGSKDRELARNFEYSVINNIELALITNNDDTDYRELANKYLSNIPDTKPQLEMLEILKNAQYTDQNEALENWKEEYKDYQFENWSFEELKRWNSNMENGEDKDRIKAYLDEFIKHNSSNQTGDIIYYDENSSTYLAP